MKTTPFSLIVLVFLTLLLIATIPAAAVKSTEQSIEDTLTRGSKFTVTITGKPNTSYYIWIPNTFSMTGEPYDQPPTLIDSTQGLSKDSEGGPYTIGSYQYYNGNGKTIRDDIAPSTASMSNTNYYGLVRTESDGKAIVEFSTSVYTGLRGYSVKVENPDEAENERLAVAIQVQSRKVPMSIYTVEPTRTTKPPTMKVTITEKPLPAPQTPDLTLQSTSVPATSPMPQPTTKAGMSVSAGIGALAVALLLTGTRQ